MISHIRAFFKRFPKDRFFRDGILFFAVPSTSRFGADFLFSAAKCFLWSSPNEIKGGQLPLREQRKARGKGDPRRRGWHWSKTVLSSERARRGATQEE